LDETLAGLEQDTNGTVKMKNSYQDIDGVRVEMHEAIPSIPSLQYMGAYYFKAGGYGIAFYCGGLSIEGDGPSEREFCIGVLRSYVSKANSVTGNTPSVPPSTQTPADYAPTGYTPSSSSSSSGCCSSAILMMALAASASVLRK
jgi:hypothetical protein